MLLGLALLSWGCDRPTAPRREPAPLLPVSHQQRAERRAFDGAPPVIPHQAFGVACVTCHTRTGKEIPTVGIASANPHWGSRQEGAFANCKQCHLFANAQDQFVANSFQGVRSDTVVTERAFPGAPPITPHAVAMRSNCLACHTGVAARPEIVCTHPERTNCVQCHVTVDPESESATFTSVP